jgi:hypothetical protein
MTKVTDHIYHEPCKSLLEFEYIVNQDYVVYAYYSCPVCKKVFVAKYILDQVSYAEDN